MVHSPTAYHAGRAIRPEPVAPSVSGATDGAIRGDSASHSIKKHTVSNKLATASRWRRRSNHHGEALVLAGPYVRPHNLLVVIADVGLLVASLGRERQPVH